MSNTNTPAARIAAAVADLPDNAHPQILAADVVAVADQVPAEKRTEETAALRKGASEPLTGLSPHRAARLQVHPPAGALRRLLEAAGGSGADPE